jgi:hypothetical protein
VKNTWRRLALAALLGAGFFAALIGLFNRQFASGELYPKFSTMRADPMGAKLMYESLGRLPGITVERNFLPFDFLPQAGITTVLLGLDPAAVNWNDGMLLESVDKIAGRGNRVILAMHVDQENRKAPQDSLDRKETGGENSAGKKSTGHASAPLEAMWKVRLKIDPDDKTPHPLWLESAEGWEVREKAGAKVLAVERASGKGTVVLMAESAAFTNESAVEFGHLADVCAAVGPGRRLIFDEQHLGLAESGSVMGMARQFRLMGLAFGLGLCALLFIWRNASGFPPPAAEDAVERYSGRTSHAGLLMLLKRHVPPGNLPAMCWREWLSTNRRQTTDEIQKHAEAILAGAATRPLDATREIQALVSAKGKL